MGKRQTVDPPPFTAGNWFETGAPVCRNVPFYDVRSPMIRQKRSLLVFVLIAMGITVFIHYVRANSSDISDKLSFAAQDRTYLLHAPGL
jgi:hypothetical protein